MKPYVISHMNTSIDGRIWGSRWRPAENRMAGLFERIQRSARRRPRRRHYFLCGGAGDSDLAAAQGGTAKTELGDLQAGVPDLSQREFSHLTLLRSGRSGGHTGWPVR